jgi:hypothetical protein
MIQIKIIEVDTMAKKINIPKVTGDVSINVVAKLKDDNTSGSSGTEKIPCTGVTITTKMLTSSKVLDKQQIEVQLTPSNTTDKISWVVFDKTVAFIDDDGVVTTIGNGETQIYAYCGNYSDYATLTVNDSSLDDKLIDFVLDVEQSTDDSNYDGEIIITEKKYNTVTFYPIPGSLLDTGTVYWSCYQTDTVAINTTQGLNQSIFPGKNGEALLTVSYDLGAAGYLRKKYKVIVDVSYELENTDILYNNPTLTVDGIKVKAEQNGIVQYFESSYIENPGYPGYVASTRINDAKGYPHYVALIEKGTSPFGINYTNPETGETKLLHLDSAGWHTVTSSVSGKPYSLNPSMLSWNNFNNWNCTVQNVNDSVPTALLNSAIDIFNQTLPGLNMTVDANSKNTVELDFGELPADYMEAFIRMNYSDESFMVYLNNTEMTSLSGEYNESNNNWISVLAHEFIHSLGAGDNAAHLPSLYDYGRPYDAGYWAQPNDIAFFKYLHKELYNMDLVTYQESTNPLNAQALYVNKEYKQYVPPIESKTFFFCTYDDKLEEHSDIILNGKLQFNRKELIKLSNSSDIELEYNIYNIVKYELEKGELVNRQIKIPVDANIDIDENKQYKLYLRCFDNYPCSLTNLKQGIKEL